MFHRVKSEGQADPKPAEQSPQQNTTIKSNAGAMMAQQTASATAQKPQYRPSAVTNQSFLKRQSAASIEIPKAPAKTGAPAPEAKEQSAAAVAAPAPAEKPAEPKAEEKQPTQQPTTSQPLKKETSTMSAPETTRAPSYTSNYAGYSAGDDSERRLTIGRGITMSGEIESCDHLVVEGTVEAALRGAQVLEIAESGTFYGSVEIQEAEIAGRFEGEIQAFDKLIVRSTGVITGEISYKQIEIEAGAQIDARLTPLAAKAPAKATAPKSKEVRVENNAPEAANEDGGLFDRTGTNA